MKLRYAVLTALAVWLHVQAQESVSIPEGVSDGTSTSEPAPEPVPINYTVLSSKTTRVDVAEAAPLTGLPPIEGTINVTMQLVADPQIVEPVAPLRATEPTDPAVLAAMEEIGAKYQGTELLLVSATVYDHSRSLVKIYRSGEQQNEITAWTNIDFNHFSGFSSFRVTQDDGTYKDYALIMGLGNTDTEQLAKTNPDYQTPQPPESLTDISVSDPDMIITDGQAEGDSYQALAHLLKLYQEKGDQLEDAYIARKQAIEDKKAAYLANPPTPKDVTIRFWKRTQEEVAE